MSEEKQVVPSKAEEPGLAWHALTIQEVVSELKTHDTEGLAAEEAARRLEQYGPNQLVEKPRPTFFQLVLAQLNNFVIILLIVAAAISAIISLVEEGTIGVESIAILAIVVLNSVLGVIQESRAEQALAALKKMAAPEAQVMRGGHRVSVHAPDLVPGDVVFLEAGNFIPADLRLIEAVNLRVEEAALTGESVPVTKNAAAVLEKDLGLGDRKNSAFMGTVVNYGRGKGIVVGTGMKTQLGLIATMLQDVEEEQTPLQKRLESLGRLLGWAALGICAVVFLVGLLRADGLTIKTIIPIFMIAVSLAIAAVPEGLPAVVTISLALGMREMVQRHALIRRLSSVETLGSATVICSDKTGTLTQNEMTVTRLWADGTTFEITGTGYKPEGEFKLNGSTVKDMHQYPGALTALWLGVLNNDAELDIIQNNGDSTYRIIGDPTEGSMLVAAAKSGGLAKELNISYPRQGEIPFDSTRKRMVTVHAVHNPRAADLSPFKSDEKREDYVVAVKGAPDIVLNLCTHIQGMDDQHRVMDDATRQSILAANDAMTKDALRVLGVAFRILPGKPEDVNEDLEQHLVFGGLIGMIDPARTEVAPALATARGAGIRTIMITGDYPNTAKAIAQSIGLLTPGHKVMTGAELNEIDDAKLKSEVQVTDVFARVSPEHKMRIVEALRANDEVVAMTGDGVNDAPAIKAADIGVAMGITGTDVAKGTADMVLTDDNYVSIVSAVEQGRIIYANIRKFVFFLLSSNVAEIMIIFLATLAGMPTPLTPIQLLWLNLLTDGAPALALAMEKGDPDVMERKPRPAKENIINGSMQLGIGIQTVTQTFAVLGSFVIGLLWELPKQGFPDVTTLGGLLRFTQWSSVDVQTAETMAFMALSLCELFRAFTVRSERASIFRLGFLSNKWMLAAVGFSILLLILVVTIPFLQPIFNTHNPSLREWLTVLGMAIVPAISEEITKYFLRLKERKA